METPPRSNKRDYDQEIIKCLEEGVMGLTITDIAKTLGISRNTVSKYLKVLEVRDIVSAQDVGVYRLYFSKNQRAIPPNMLNSLFWGVIAGLKKVFPDHPEMFKKLGGEIDKSLTFPLIGGKLEEIIAWLNQITNKQFYDAVAFLLPRIFFIAENAYVKSFTIERDDRAVYLLTNTTLMQKEDYIYALYIMAGFLESYFWSKYKKKITCDILDCCFSPFPGEGYVKIGVQVPK